MVVTQTHSDSGVKHHNTLVMTYLAVTRGFAPENGGTFAKAKDEPFAEFRIGLREYIVPQNRGRPPASSFACSLWCSPRNG